METDSVYTITVTPEQARHVAALIQQARAAQQALDHAVHLLALGADLPDTAALTHVDTETGVFTFTAPEA
jgi:hypothetical protein